VTQRTLPRPPAKGTKEIPLLLSILDEAFDARAWHGTTLRGSLRGVAATIASRHPRPGRHSIWEIVLHTAYWKYAVRRMLTGADRGSFPLKGSNWFPVPEEPPPTAGEWNAAVRLLAQEHRLLREAVEGLRDRDLDTPTPKGQHTYRRIIYGVALHDVHHEGQIQLTKRLLTSGPARRAGRGSSPQRRPR
jgi:uncharacterized damage-inducible protein DinB